MKALILSFALALGFSAHAKTYTIKGQEALRLVEAMVYAGATLNDVDSNNKKEATYLPVVCRYLKTADEIATDPHCYLGLTGIGGGIPPEFPRESLAFFQAIRNYGKEVTLFGFPALQVDNVTCTMRISPRRYVCTITVN